MFTHRTPAVLALLLAACAEAPTEAVTTTTTTDTGTEYVAPVPTIRWTGVASISPLMVPKAGAEVCPDDPELDCAIADDDGAYALHLPIQSEQVVTVTAEGYVPAISVLTVGEQDQDRLYAPLLGRNMVADKAESVGLEQAPGTGSISFLTWDDANGVGLANFTAEILDDDQLPYYTEGLDLSLTAVETSSAGTGFFVNVAPGEYQVRMDGPTPCATGKYAHDDGVFTVPVRAGAITHILCLLPE